MARRSVSSGVLLNGAHFLSGWVSGQSVVALSSGEAEYYSLCRLVAELLFVVYLYREMKREAQGLARTDSSAAKGMEAGVEVVL